MDFTREPIIETIITPKDGWTLVVRNSKGVGLEEFFVDAVEVVTYGSVAFFRSRERPKSFLVPASDYEVLEARETRLVLKNISLERSVKIGPGRESSARATKDPAPEKIERPVAPISAPDTGADLPAAPSATTEAEHALGKGASLEKKRDRKRNYRRKRPREEVAFREEGEPSSSTEENNTALVAPLTSVIASLLPPPPRLISETIALYKDNALFKGAFFSKEETVSEPSSPASEPNFAELEFEKEEKFIAIEELNSLETPQMSLDFPVYGEVGSSLIPQHISGFIPANEIAEQMQGFPEKEETLKIVEPFQGEPEPALEHDGALDISPEDLISEQEYSSPFLESFSSDPLAIELPQSDVVNQPNENHEEENSNQH